RATGRAPAHRSDSGESDRGPPNGEWPFPIGRGPREGEGHRTGNGHHAEEAGDDALILPPTGPASVRPAAERGQGGPCPQSLAGLAAGPRPACQLSVITRFFRGEKIFAGPVPAVEPSRPLLRLMGYSGEVRRLQPSPRSPRPPRLSGAG